MSPEGAGRFSGRGNRGVGEQRGQASLSVPSRKVCGMSGQRFRCTPGGVCSLGLHLVWCPKYRRRVLGGQIAGEHGWQIVAQK